MDPYADLGMTAQQQHDEATRRRIRLTPNSRQVLEGLLAKKEKLSSSQLPSGSLDSIGHRVSQVDGLTMEEAEAELMAIGFM